MYNGSTLFKKIVKETASDIRIPLLLSSAVYCLYLTLTAIDHIFSLGSRLVCGGAGCIMVFLFYLSWKSYKNDTESIMKTVLLGTAAILSSFLCYIFSVDDLVEEMFWFLFMIAPVFLVSISNMLFRRRIRNKVLLGIINGIPWLLVTAVCFMMEGTELFFDEFIIVLLIWLAENLIWSFALNV